MSWLKMIETSSTFYWYFFYFLHLKNVFFVWVEQNAICYKKKKQQHWSLVLDSYNVINE